jgi:hypothetical protein
MPQKPLSDLLRMREELSTHDRLLRDAARSLELRQSATMRRLAEATMRAALPAYLQEAMQAWERQTTALRVHTEVLRGWFDPLRLPDFAAPLSGVARAMQEAARRMSEVEAAIAATHRLRFKELEDASAILAQMGQSLAFAKSMATHSEIVKMASAIKAPWLEAGAAARSLESLASLQSLGNALRLSVFGPEEAEAVRKALGDWRGIRLPEEVFSDWQARSAFYRRLGFDSRLTELPEPAFTESLRLTHVWRGDLFSPALPIVEEEQEVGPELPDARAAIRQRMVQAYDALFNFEQQVRSFLVRVMTERYGTRWMKRRVPPTTLLAWRRKRDEQSTRGLPRRQLFQYADFTDYLPIIIRADNWNEIFSGIFRNSDDVQVSFQRLFPLRVCTMHGRELSKDDFLLLLVETRRILRAIGAIPGDASGIDTGADE